MDTKQAYMPNTAVSEMGYTAERMQVKRGRTNMYCIDCCYDGEQGIYYCRVYKGRRYVTVYYAKTYDECRDMAERAYGRANAILLFDEVIPA